MDKNNPLASVVTQLANLALTEPEARMRAGLSTNHSTSDLVQCLT